MTTDESSSRKQIDPAALSSILHGVVLCDFSQIHEAAEWVAGHPVYTHQFLDEPLRARMTAEILRQFPTMSVEKPSDWLAARDALHAEFGLKVDVERGCGEAPHILAGLPDDVDPFFIVAGGEA